MIPLFIKLTHADGSGRSVWINLAHIAQMDVAESTGKTMLYKSSDEDAPVAVVETPKEVISQINALRR